MPTTESDQGQESVTIYEQANVFGDALVGVVCVMGKQGHLQIHLV